MKLRGIVRALKRFGLVYSAVARFRRYQSAVTDRFLGIDTSWENDPKREGYVSDERQPYMGVHYPQLKGIVRHLAPGPDDVVYDIGCGKGRVLCVFARQPIKKCVGIEILDLLGAKAQENLERLRGRRCPFEIRVGDAANMDYSDGTIFFLYNPFGRKTLEGVLRKIEESIGKSPRRVRLVYFNPVHAWVLPERGWNELGQHTWLLYHSPVTYWTYSSHHPAPTRQASPTV